MIKIVTERGEPSSNKMESTVRSYVLRLTKVKKVLHVLHQRPISKDEIKELAVA